MRTFLLLFYVMHNELLLYYLNGNIVDPDRMATNYFQNIFLMICANFSCMNPITNIDSLSEMKNL